LRRKKRRIPSKNTYPERARSAALEARGGREGEDAALDAKTRELVALGASARIPCTYCV
jgi:alkylhydroperoxidase/carboxymuconolactone decarboxylase family protein YurZ